jgi:arsenite-activated ATPase arsA
MENKLKDVLSYIVKNYPYSDDLTKTRTTKLVYLVDWEYIKKYGRQLTSIEWFFDHYGPYVSDVLDEADKDRRISIKKTKSNFGTVKYMVMPKFTKNDIVYSLTADEIEVIDDVIEKTKLLSWNQFIRYVYDTSPIKNSEKYKKLDLLKYVE